MRRPPVVTDGDRKWAIEQEPADWAERTGAKRRKPAGPRFTDDGELIEDDDEWEAPTLLWSQHVDEQIEAFERHWSATGERKPATEWSGLWRRVSWPQADPSIRHPKIKGKPHPFVKRGQPGWAAALKACTKREREMAERFGVIQFRPTDPRAEIIARAA